MNMRRAKYSHTVDRGVVCIVDNDQGMSVTNAADEVIAELVRAGAVSAAGLVVYRDTRGTWDQLVVSNGQFSGFKLLNESTQAGAVAKVLGVVPKQFSRHRSREEVITLAKASNVKVDASYYDSGTDHLVVYLPGPTAEIVKVLFNVVSGRFFYAPEDGAGFSSDDKLDGQPWFDAMLDFFYTEAGPALPGGGARMSKVVGIQTDEGVEWHAEGAVGDYDSLCGIDANDSSVGHRGLVEPRRGQKITCAQCFGIWSKTIALRLRRANFNLENGAANE